MSSKINLQQLAKTLAQKKNLPQKDAEAFLRAKWRWVMKVRAEMLSRPPVDATPLTEAERAALEALLDELNAAWRATGATGAPCRRPRRFRNPCQGSFSPNFGSLVGSKFPRSRVKIPQVQGQNSPGPGSKFPTSRVKIPALRSI